MAEGGDQPSSIQAGSDAYITFVCTPCSEEGTREESIQYCPECDEYLCTTCTKYHRKMKTTRDHKLVDKEEGSHVSNVLKTTPKVKCQKHPDRDIEMFCGTHDMVYCLMCIAIDHRSCSDVTSLSDAAGSNFKPHDTERLQEELVSVKELLVASEIKKRENIALIEEKRNTIQRRVQEIEDSVIKHMKVLSQQANTTVNETYSKVKGKLETEISMLGYKQSEVEKAKVELESTNEDNQEQRFVQAKLSQKIINDTKHIYTKLVGRIAIDFAENTGEIRQLLEISSFGKVNEDQEGTMKMEIQYQKEKQVQGGARKMEIKCQKEEEVQEGARKMEIKGQKEKEAPGSARKMEIKCQKEEEAPESSRKMEMKCQKEKEAPGSARKMEIKCQKEEEAPESARKMENKCKKEEEVQGGFRKMEINYPKDNEVQDEARNVEIEMPERERSSGWHKEYKNNMPEIGRNSRCFQESGNKMPERERSSRWCEESGNKMPERERNLRWCEESGNKMPERERSSRWCQENKKNMPEIRRNSRWFQEIGNKMPERERNSRWCEESGNEMPERGRNSRWCEESEKLNDKRSSRKCQES